MVAIVNGHIEIVDLLLRNGAALCMRSIVPAITLAGKSGPPGLVTELLRVIGGQSRDFISTALVFAVAEGCALTVAELLRLGADASAATDTGLHPLIVASERGQAELVQMLLQANANVNVVSGSQLTPLAVAARNGHASVVAVLLKAAPSLEAIDTALVFAGKMGHSTVVDTLVQAGLAMFSTFGPSALRLAVMDNCELVIQRLIEVGVEVDNRSPKGLTALLAASERGMERAVQQLLGAKADVRGTSDGGLTPLVVASVNGHEGVVQQLLAAKADVCGSENISAIVLAGRHGHHAVVARLLQNGAERQDDFYSFALLFAIAEGCAATVRLLLEAGVDVNHRNRDGTTALMACSERGSADVVRLLLDAGAEVNAVAYNLTALAVASRNGHCAVVRHLLEAGADLSTYETALLFAGKSGHLDVVEEIVHAGYSRTLDMQNGKSAFCEGTLRLAISSNCRCVVESLLRHGASPDDGTSPPPLMIASERGLADIVVLLLNAHADPNSATDNGLSALVVASVNGHTQVVEELLAGGATVAANDNIQAVVLAGKYGHDTVVQRLIRAGQNEGADFSKALLSAIVDDCDTVVAQLLETGACSAHGENEMPLRLAFHQQHRTIVGQLLAGHGNLQQDSFGRVFGDNSAKLLGVLEALVLAEVGGRRDVLAPALHPLADNLPIVPVPMLQPVLPWWEGDARMSGCFLPGCPGLPHTAAAPFLPGLATLKRHSDLPCLTDGLLPILCHAAHAWHERLHPFLPLAAQRLIRLVMLAWCERAAMAGISFDLLRVVFSFTVLPSLLRPD
eukprot:GGOE01005620.1.p1 GENE.GGOE01005620.1~~GGOE01005620.1.p1  ORF type:complete len:878 (-),score=266.00 GGOE01005620.1:287-2677(-)